MPAPPISIKLRCTSWSRVASIYKRDLSRGALFLRTKNPPPVDTDMQVHLVMPSQTVVILNATVAKHVGPGGMGGRGPGVDLKVQSLPQSALWLIESAVKRAEEEKTENAAHPEAAPGAEPANAEPASAETPSAGPARPAAVNDYERDEESKEVDFSRLAEGEESREMMLAGVRPGLDGAGEMHGRAAGEESRDIDVHAARDASRDIDVHAARDASRDIDVHAARDDDPESVEAKLVKGLAEQLARIRIMTPEQILRVTADTDEATLRAAYAKRAKRYRPDNFARFQDERIRSQAAEIFILIHKAYNALSRGTADTVPAPPAITGAEAAQPEAAQPEPAQPEPAQPEPAQPEAAQPEPAEPEIPEIALSEIEIEVEEPETEEPETEEPETEEPETEEPEAAQPEPAEPEISEISLSEIEIEVEEPEPEEPEPAAAKQSRLSGPGFDLIDAGRLKEARGYFVKARRLDPNDPVIGAGLELTEGLMAFEDGDRLEAAQRFEAVLAVDPENERAIELLAEIKKRTAEERKSHLQRLRELNE